MFNFEINNWFRALARFCDYSIFFLALGAVTLFLPYFYGPFFYYYLALAIPFLWAPVEALLVSKWGTTPGKTLFGLSVGDAMGRNLSYSSALKWALFLPGRPGTVRQKNVSWKRKLCAFLTSSAFVMAAIYGNVLALWSVGLEKGISPEGWVQYSSADAGFKVSFPTDPEAASKELVIPDSGKVLSYKEITTDESEKVRYSVSHLDLPRKWRLAGNTTLLKGVLDLMVKHTEGSVLLEKEFRMHGQHRVLDYRLKQGKDEVKGRLIIVGGTLYKLTVVYPQSHAKELEQNPFLDSFEIT
ncbi:MAG: RDD family protein [Verrucomicrobia bacterium]|nr:RDD family protein [Verrucomicrobiota bacterium]